VALGQGSSAAFTSCVALGSRSTATATGAVALGADSTADNDCVVIGHLSTSNGNSDNTIVGDNASAANPNCVVIGAGATATGSSKQVVIGSEASGAHQGAVSIGFGAASTKVAQLVIGSDQTAGEIVEAVIGAGVTNATPNAQLLITTTNGVGTDIHATDLILQSGRSTGAGAVTDMIFKTPDVGSSGATLQAATTRLTLNESVAAFTSAVTAPNISKISNGTAITATDTSDAGERMLYDPTGGTFQINAPATPILGMRWATKNRSSSATAVTISGNGSDIEDPTSSFSLAANFSLSGDGISVEWEYDGTQWLVV